VVQPFASPDATEPLRLGVSRHRRNHHSPASNVLLVGDGELLAGTREAATAGLDEVVWLNLDDAVSCIGAGALFAEIDGRVITPPRSDGVPDTAWRNACIEEMDVMELRLEVAQLRAAESVACLWPWGSVQTVEMIDGASFADASLAPRIADAVVAAGSRT
jgi:branched-chain amino acid aminotransferase